MTPPAALPCSVQRESGAQLCTALADVSSALKHRLCICAGPIRTTHSHQLTRGVYLGEACLDVYMMYILCR